MTSKLRPILPRQGLEPRKQYERIAQESRTAKQRTMAGGVDKTERMAVKRVYADHHVMASELVIEVMSTAAARSVRLPDAKAYPGRRIQVKDGSFGGVNNITVRALGSQLIDNASTLTLAPNGAKVTLRSNGQRWLTE